MAELTDAAMVTDKDQTSVVRSNLPPNASDTTTERRLTPIASAVLSTRHSVTPGWKCVVTTFKNTDQAFDLGSVDLEKRHVVYSSKARSMDSLDSVVITQGELDLIEKAHPLPAKPNTRIVRLLRWRVFSMYRRMFALVFLVNMAAIAIFLSQLFQQQSSPIASYKNAATAAAANFCVGVLMRNEHVVNGLFRIACGLPVWSPFVLRRYAAKVYSYGGFHSGCGVSGAIWYIVFCALVINQFQNAGWTEVALATTSGITLFLLMMIIVFALPSMRRRLHDHFERTHRFGGWAAIASLWTQTMVLVWSASEESGRPFSAELVITPSFWFLLTITGCLIYPWTRLRSCKVVVEHLSKHATRLHFDYRNMETCVGVRLTDNPLKETHSFATIPNYKGTPGFSVIISNAGDWTKKIIGNPPSHLWVKGAPTLGVMRVGLLFKKILVIATGSGIGPCLSLLQVYPDYPMRVIWSAPKPEETYGKSIMSAVFRADPEAIIVDTKKTGRGNLLALAYSMFKQSEAEAAIIIANPVVTKKIVYGLEARGVAAYGAIFDS